MKDTSYGARAGGSVRRSSIPRVDYGGVDADDTGSPVFLARTDWHLKCTQDDWPKIRFLKTREQT